MMILTAFYHTAGDGFVRHSKLHYNQVHITTEGLRITYNIKINQELFCCNLIIDNCKVLCKFLLL